MENGNGRLRLPKRILGVKLPKPLRRTAEMLIGRAASPAGREMLARALESAAAALRRGTVTPPGGAPRAAEGPTPVDRIAPLVGMAANAFGKWLGEAARSAPRKNESAPPKPE